MKVAFERESVIEPDWNGNRELPEAERVRVHIKWPTMLEDSKIPVLNFSDRTFTVKGKAEVMRYPDDASMAVYSDYLLRHHVGAIENLDGINTGTELADAPKEFFELLIYPIALSFRLGPQAILEKKRDL